MLVFVTWAYGLCSTFICFLYRHTLRWAEYYGRSFPACMLGLLICLFETFSCRPCDPLPQFPPWPVQTHLFPPPSPPTPQEGSGTIVADGGATKGAAESNIPVLVFSTTRTGAMARRELLMLTATSTWRRRGTKRIDGRRPQGGNP